MVPGQIRNEELRQERRKAIKDVFACQLPLWMWLNLTKECWGGKKHKACTFALYHPRGKGTVASAYQTALLGVVVNSQEVLSSIMSSKVSTSDQKKQKNTSAGS